jgi:hypothetical protein
MNRFLLATIILGVCGLAACKKGEPVSAGLFGKWELRRLYGGFSYRDSIYKPGNGTYYQFNSDSTYKHYTKNRLDTQGVYHIRKFDNSTMTWLPDRQIFFDNVLYGQPFQMNGSKITIGTTVTDGIALDYQKISN